MDGELEWVRRTHPETLWTPPPFHFGVFARRVRVFQVPVEAAPVAKAGPALRARMAQELRLVPSRPVTLQSHPAAEVAVADVAQVLGVLPLLRLFHPSLPPLAVRPLVAQPAGGAPRRVVAVWVVALLLFVGINRLWKGGKTDLSFHISPLALGQRCT